MAFFIYIAMQEPKKRFFPMWSMVYFSFIAMQGTQSVKKNSNNSSDENVLTDSLPKQQTSGFWILTFFDVLSMAFFKNAI